MERMPVNSPKTSDLMGERCFVMIGIYIVGKNFADETIRFLDSYKTTIVLYWSTKTLSPLIGEIS